SRKDYRRKKTPKYDKIWKPGEKPIYPGIYRCQSCGYEDVINRECTKLPPCTNCEQKKHKDNTWKLLVRAELVRGGTFRRH
ncbi:hypothetical protein ELR99_25370, partial [Salmonella enterica subsp. enterica serovar Newport]|nr:hypothetical protein [Salmonella enterica subsp. enterica serovar Montevideo]ECA5183315.1 hypothetical protein [Salmonella enterica subsp. enterica serovar Newport]ECD4584510.1 hypothetical protein [Salmonella enterica subsp. enterica serovar Newport]